MLEVLQVSAPWLAIWGCIIAFLAILKLSAKIFKFRNIDDSIKF